MPVPCSSNALLTSKPKTKMSSFGRVLNENTQTTDRRRLALEGLKELAGGSEVKGGLSEGRVINQREVRLRRRGRRGRRGRR